MGSNTSKDVETGEYYSQVQFCLGYARQLLTEIMFPHFVFCSTVVIGP